MRAALIAVLFLTCARAANAQTPQEWIDAGQRVHGGFGSLIAVGIRVGLAALHDLDARPREVDVTFFDGADTPCPCIVDGIMVATSASPGQRSLRVAPDPAPRGSFAAVEFKSRVTGRVVRYTIPEAARPLMLGWNRLPTARERHDAVMAAPEADLFRRQPSP